MFENAKIKEGDRRVEYVFDGDVTVDEHGKEWVQRIKVVCDHSKDYKRFTASVWRCLARTDGPFNVERFDDLLSGHNNDTFLRESVERYSARAFDAFCGRAMREAEKIVADNDTFVLAAVLLRIAAEYSRGQVLA